MKTRVAALVCLTMLGPGPAGLAETPSPEAIAAAAERVLAGEEYSLERTTDYSLGIMNWIMSRIADFLNWLADLLGIGGIIGNLSLNTVKTIVALCVAVLLAILGYNAYVLYKMRRMPPEHYATLGPARSVTAAEMIEDAQRLAGERNFVDASRRLFLAALILLEEKRGGRMRQGLTNSEYLQSFRTPWVRENLRVFVDLINWKWYRHQSFDAGDFHRCQAAFDTIASRLDEMET